MSNRRDIRREYLMAIRAEVDRCRDRQATDEAWKQSFWGAAAWALVGLAEHVRVAPVTWISKLKQPWQEMSRVAQDLYPDLPFAKAVMTYGAQVSARLTQTPAPVPEPLPDNVVPFPARRAG